MMETIHASALGRLLVLGRLPVLVKLSLGVHVRCNLLTGA